MNNGELTSTKSTVGCDYCDKRFSRKHDRQRHCLSVHAQLVGAKEAEKNLAQQDNGEDIDAEGERVNSAEPQDLNVDPNIFNPDSEDHQDELAIDITIGQHIHLALS